MPSQEQRSSRGGLPPGRDQIVPILYLWLPFLAVWLLSNPYNPLTHIPGYGDTLEVVWGANWYAEHLRSFSNPLFHQDIFYPTGWPTALLPHPLTFSFAMGVFRLFLSEAATYNLFVFASFVVAYAGAIKAARLFTSKLWIIAVAALLYTYWGMRWVRLGGHQHMLWMSAFLPWLFWVLYVQDRRRRIFGTALIWALAIVASFYSIWTGALIVGLYFLNKPSLDRLREVAAIALLALLFSLPTILPFWHAQQQVSAPFLSLDHIADWGASLNSLPVPSLFHPWLGAFARTLYSGALDESAVANLGLIAALAGLAYLLVSRLHDEKERFALLLCLAGLIIGLGPVLRWNGRIVEASLFAPLNTALWNLGSLLKPAVFPGDIPPAMANSVPLPGWLLYAGLPFMEGNRVAARFAFIGGLGLVLLLTMLMDRLKAQWLVLPLALLLLFERVPWPERQAVPMPSVSHPAFEQLAGQSGAIIDLVPSGDLLTLAVSGETLYAVDRHQKPTASGVGTVRPAAAWFLFDWLWKHPRPLQHEDFAAVLQGYGVNWILVHMTAEEAWLHLQEDADSRLTALGCLDPPAQPAAWPYPICLFQVADPDPAFAADALDGWSAPEAWGRWAVGTESSARWAVPIVQEYELILDAFPNWVDGRTQEVTILIDDQPLGVLTFEQDEPVSARFTIPAEHLQVGWNTLTFAGRYAISPAEATNGANPDPRPLSFGVTRLQLRPTSP